MALGTNVEDLQDYRPRPVRRADGGAVFPLLDAGLTRADVRAVSRSLGLVTADKAGRCVPVLAHCVRRSG